MIEKMYFFPGLFLMSFIAPGFCIDCYRCNSTGTLDCLEKFMYPNPLRAESCADVFEARFCIKTTGIYNNEIGTQRFCSDKDMGNYCDFITHDKRNYKGCVYTCSTDGCNAADSNFQVPLYLVTLVTLTTMVLRSKTIS